MSNAEMSWRYELRIAHQNFLSNRKPRPVANIVRWRREQEFEAAVEQRGAQARAAFYKAHPDLEGDPTYAA